MKQGKKTDARMPELRNKLLVLQGEMTAKDFADKLGLSRQTVGFYLSGQRIPDAKTIAQICRLCNVSSDWLLGLSEDRSLHPSAVDELGLPEEAIRSFSELSRTENDELSETVRCVIGNKDFFSLLFKINAFISAKKAGKIIGAISEQEMDYLRTVACDSSMGYVLEVRRAIFEKTLEIAKNGKYGKAVSNSIVAQLDMYRKQDTTEGLLHFFDMPSLSDLAEYNVNNFFLEFLKKLSDEQLESIDLPEIDIESILKSKGEHNGND